MSKIFRFLFVFIVFTNIGCKKSTISDEVLLELIQAEKIMFNSPDSALSILQSMSVPSPKKDKGNNALWSLLVTQAQYKQVMKVSSDSLARVAYDYYKTTKDIRRRAMSALYLGGVNYDLGNIEKALHLYLEAKTEVEKVDDNQLGYLIMSGLGDIYLYRHLTEYALDACKQAYNYAKQDSNKRYQMAALQYIARCYCLLGNLDNAEKAYYQCSRMALELNIENAYNNIQKELALVYTNKRQFDKSLDIIKSLPYSSQKLLLIGQNYFLLGNLDSAHFYLQESLQTDNIYTKKSIYEFLYQLSTKPKFHKYLKNYCDSLLFYNDSIMSLDKSKEIIAYKEKYNNEKLISEKRKLELDKAYVTNCWMFTIMIVLLLIIILIYVFLHKKLILHKKEEELANLTLQLYDKEQEIDKNQLFIAELQSRYNESNKNEEFFSEQEDIIIKLKKENEQLCLEKKLLHERIKSYSINAFEVANIKILSDKIHLLEKREKNLCLQLLNQIPLLHQLHLKPIYLDDSELIDISNIVDSIFENFTSRLLNDIPSLTEHEIILCSLIKLRFSNSEISVFLNIASTSVSRSKLRIKNKIYSELKEESQSKNLDFWIWEY